MLKEQGKASMDIMDALSKRPITRIFCDCSIELTNTSISRPLTFDLIYDKVKRNLYKSIDEWISDMRIMFSNFIIAFPDDSLKKAAAQQLSAEFEEKIQQISPTSSPFTIKFQMLESDISKLLNTVRIAEGEPTPSPKEPAAAIFNQKQEATIPNITRNIRMLHSSELFMKVIAFIWKLQPEAVSLGQSVSFDFCLMSQETMEKLNEFVLGLLRDAAVGLINPYRNQSGSPSESPVITSILTRNK